MTENKKTQEVVRKQIKNFLNKTKKRKKQEIKERGTLIIAGGMLVVAYLMLVTTNKQVDISEDQTKILSQQTEILSQQTEIENSWLGFEQDKHQTDTMKDYRKTMNELFNSIYFVEDGVLRDIHQKVIRGEKVQNLVYLDRYVNERENIGALFCDGKIKVMDLRGILKSSIEKVCGNSQIYYHYQDTKSGLSALCETLFPGSSVMAKHANPQKCPELNKK